MADELKELLETEVEQPNTSLTETSGTDPVVFEEPKEDEVAKKDLEKARQKLNKLIDQGSEAVDGIMEVAAESQSPRAYEVAAKVMQATAEVVDRLTELHKTKVAAASQKITVEKAVFVGSSADTTKMLEERRAAKKAGQVIDVKP